MSKLIDANKLMKIFENDIQMTQSWLDKCESTDEIDCLTVQLDTIKSYQAIVEDMPTAYDIDKVVEQLKALDNEEVDYYSSNDVIDREDAVEIVKAGGLYE